MAIAKKGQNLNRKMYNEQNRQFIIAASGDDSAVHSIGSVLHRWSGVCDPDHDDGKRVCECVCVSICGLATVVRFVPTLMRE